MAILIKNSEQLKLMRVAGEIAAKTHMFLKKMIRPGITTKDLNRAAEEFILSQGATPSFKGYRKFPASICTSINCEVIHGIPNSKALRQGDILSIDIGTYIGGFHGDSSRTYGVGAISEENKKLIDVTRNSFFEAIRYAKAGRNLYEISAAIQHYVELNGFSVVRDYVGHGIGKQLHEPPDIPCYKPKNRGPKLYPGMVLAIEPMVNMGSGDVELLNDNITIVTCDKKNSAHYENTVVITDKEPELLTIMDEEN